MAFILFFTLKAFSGTEISSYKDRSATKIYNIVLISIETDLQNKRPAEEKVASVLSKKSTGKFLVESDLLPPTKIYSEKEQVKILKEYGIEAILRARIIDSASSTQNVSIPTYGISFGNTGGSSFTVATPTTYNYDHTVYAWVTKIEMWDVLKNERVWVANATTTGTTEEKMKSSLIKKATDEIILSNMVESNGKPIIEKRSFSTRWK